MTRNGGPSSPVTSGPVPGIAARPRLIADALRASISDGTWSVGSRIPTEPELAQLLGVGRNAVREAVQSLVHAGLLVKRQGSGTYVLSDDELSQSLKRHVTRSTHEAALEVRRALEMEAAGLAATRRTARDVATLRVLKTARETAFDSGDVAAMTSTDLVLHRAIVAAGRNPLLLSLYESLVDAISTTVTGLTRGAAADTSPGSLEDLVEAIAAGDPVAAIAALGSPHPADGPTVTGP